MNRYRGARRKVARATYRTALDAIEQFDRLQLEYRRMLWVAARLDAGLSATEAELEKAKLPEASITTAGPEAGSLDMLLALLEET
jgi:hypothetical protein